jgi:hypothetical protein
MSRLHDQHQRLYGTEAGRDAPGCVRALVIGLSQPADWGVLSVLWRGVQADLDLPAPGIVVNGADGLELWFSLAEPQAVADAAAWVDGLVKRYLPDVKPQRVRRWPASEAWSERPPLAPRSTCVDRWSAFVAPDLAAVFADDPALDMPPGDDAQADLLSRLESMRPAAFKAALAQLVPDATVPQNTVEQQLASDGAGTAHCGPVPEHRGLNGPYQDPRVFLLAVMNDSTAPLAQRIEAARALLPQGPSVQP